MNEILLSNWDRGAAQTQGLQVQRKGSPAFCTAAAQQHQQHQTNHDRNQWVMAAS